MDPIEAFQIATTYIAEGNYVKAVALLDEAAIVMAGNADFDVLYAKCRAKCAG